jgi:hypothetical protein
MVYHIAPGVDCDSIAILNCENTSVRIQTDYSPAYDTTISTGAKDIVKTDLAAYANAGTHFTITINKTAGTAKVGEIILGNVTDIGALTPTPEVGILDYSIKEVDEWGNWSVTERPYAKWMSCSLELDTDQIDTIYNLLGSYRATPVVWIGSSSYSCLILYGFFKDFSMIVGSRDKSKWELSIEGVI